MPVLLASGEEDGVAGTNLFDRATLALNPTLARDDDNSLAGRVSVPHGAGAGEKVTLAVEARPGASGIATLSTRALPVKLSGVAPGLDGADALRVIFNAAQHQSLAIFGLFKPVPI